MTEDPLRRAAECVARGVQPPEDPELNERQARNLRRLAAIADLFAQGPTVTQRQWGHLNILEPLGEGGFGIVFRAHDPVLKRDVALKLRRHVDGENSDRLITEARRLARVRHPNVLAVHGADIHEGQVGIWADLIGGQTLAERIATGWRARGGALTRLVSELVQALLAVHGRGLVHGDVKPSNLMFDDDGRMILMDFGASQQAETSGSPRYGSPRYMAPELFDGAPATAASDVYACGVVACFAATGRYPATPHSSRDATKYPAQEGAPLKHDNPLGYGDLRRTLGKDWADLLTGMFAAAPSRRLSADDVAHGIRRIQSAPGRRRRRWTITVIVLSLAAGLSLALVGRHHARQALEAAQKSAAHTAAVNSMLESLLRSPRPTELGMQVTVAEALDDFSPQLATALIDQPMARAELLLVVGRTRQSLGELELAEQTLREAFELASTTSPNSVLEYTVAQRLVEVLLARDRHDEGFALVQERLARVDEDWPDHGELRSVLRMTAGYAAALANQRDLARDLLDEAATLAEAVAWNNPGDRAAIRLRQASLALRDGRMADASGYAEMALSIAQEHLGECHVNTLHSRALMAQIRIETGRVREALPLAETNYELARSWLGPDTRYTWGQAMPLAVAYHALGRHETAIELLNEVIASIDRIRGPDSVPSMVARNNLANNFKYLGRFEDAITLYAQIRDTAIRTVGQDHVQVLIASNNLAEAYLDSGHYTEAASHSLSAMQRNTSVLGAEHPFTTHASMVHWAANAHQGQATEAVVALDTAARKFAQTMGETSELYFQARSYQARASLEAGDHLQAQSIVIDNLEPMLETLGPDHPVYQRLKAVQAALPSRAES